MTYPSLKARVLNRLEELQHDSLTSGWEETFLINFNDQNVFLSIELQESLRQTSSHNSYVPDYHTFSAICTKIMASLRNFLDSRLTMDS